MSLQQIFALLSAFMTIHYLSFALYEESFRLTILTISNVFLNNFQVNFTFVPGYE